ncbi:sphingosine-1-phosphate phosphatase 2 [Lissotriton helveticus]
MDSLLQTLQDSELVARFQRACGLHAAPAGGTHLQNGGGAHLSNGNGCPAPRKGGQGAHCQNGSANGVTSNGTHKQDRAAKYIVKNYFLYYLFRFAAALGQEVFYITFLPFTYWNMDPYIARKLISVWAFVMYIGQVSKDLLKWPRPKSPPVVKLETRVDAEYGMPSTHAMAATAISFTFLLSTMDRYKYPFDLGLAVAVFTSSLVSLSRLYTGMHTVLDVIVGALVSGGFVALTYPLWDIMDHILLETPFCPLLVTVVPFVMCYNYPKLDHYSPTRADTTIIMGVFTGSSIGFWMNHQHANDYGPFGSLPLSSSSFTMLAIVTVRFLVGLCVLILTRQVVKTISLHVLCFWYKASVTDPEARQQLEIEVPYKFVTYSSIGIAAIRAVPLVYHFFGI